MEERLGSWNVPRFVIFHQFSTGICSFCTREVIINSVSQCNRAQTPPSLATTETAYYPVVESILEWPVFEGLTSLRKGQSLAIADPDEVNYKESPDDPTNHCPETGSSGLDIDIEYAIRMFLQNVHSKNPILDSQVLNEAVCCCSENGFDMSIGSALVVKHYFKHVQNDRKLTFCLSLRLLLVLSVSARRHMYHPKTCNMWRRTWHAIRPRSCSAGASKSWPCNRPRS
jgi:hypothetical protein